MTTHDTLITRFRIEDEYSGPASKIVAATRSIANATRSVGSSVRAGLSGVGGVFESIGQSIINGLKNPLTSVIALLTGGALVAGIVGFARSALGVATTFDMIERSFYGVLGSWDKVKSMMDYLKAYTVPSAYGLEPLAQAAALLARNKIDVGTFLPIAEMLAMATGQGGPDALLDAARLLMRLRGGDIAAAFSTQEGIGRFGISKRDVAAMGGKFDAQGQFQGSVEEAFDVIARTVRAKLGGVKEAMQDTMEAAFSNAATAVQMALADIGKVFYRVIAPIMSRVSEVLTQLTQSGQITQWAESITKVFNVPVTENPLVKAVTYFVSAIQEIPNMWQYVKTGFMVLANASAAMFGAVINNLNTIIGLVNNLIDMSNALNPFGNMGRLQTLPGVESPFTGQQMFDQLAATQQATGGRSPGEMVADRYRRNLDAFGSIGGGGVRGGLPTPPFTGDEPGAGAGGASDPLERIARNTEATAANTGRLVERYEQTVFGGSELGRHGITAREVKEIRRGAGGSSFDAKIEEATRLIADAVLGLQARTIRAT